MSILFKYIGSRVVDELPGLDVWLLQEAAKKLNFSYNIVTPEENQWGIYHANNVSNGASTMPTM